MINLNSKSQLLRSQHKNQIMDTIGNPFITLNAVICSAFVHLCLAVYIANQLFKMLSVKEKPIKFFEAGITNVLSLQSLLKL